MSATTIEARIQAALRQIEQEEQVRIVYACESGSRAWGFPSQDSDYDVRFLYIRPVRSYLSIFERRDVIERPIDNLLDINGWDLRKALLLFRKSNPPLMEWLQSPIRYVEVGGCAERLRMLSEQIFSPRAAMYHYLHMAQGNFRDYLRDDQVRLKKYFYVLRPLLACGWMERNGTLPPLDFGELCEALVERGSELRLELDELLQRKLAGEELSQGARIEPIHAYMEEKLHHYAQLAGEMTGSQVQADEQLDTLFQETIQAMWT